MNIHTLTQDCDCKTVTCVFHVPIPPTGTNQAGLTWREAVVLWLGGAENIDSVLDNIDGDELTAMKSGAILEVQKNIRFSSVNISEATRLVEIQAFFTTEKDIIVAEKQIILQWMGLGVDAE